MTLFGGSDPGNVNYGYSIVDAKYDVRRKRLRVTIKEIGMWTTPVNNLTNKPAKPPKSKRRKRTKVMYRPFPEQFEDFMYEWSVVCKQLRGVASERFQSRGFQGSATIEMVSTMNAAICLSALQSTIPFYLITAATWKNQVNRYVTLEDVYKDNRKNLPPHSIDSCFIAIYAALQHYHIKWEDVDYKFLLNQFKDFVYEKPKTVKKK